MISETEAYLNRELTQAEELCGNLREALRVAAQALAEASTELDAAGCSRASLYAATRSKAAWAIASGQESAPDA